MKKTYSKPEILFEDFSLSTSIAKCDVTTNFAKNQCGFYWPVEGNIFVSGVSVCEAVVEDDGSSGYCYHVPFDDSQLFAS